MKKFGTLCLALSLAAGLLAQEGKSLGAMMAQSNVLNHMDIGVNVGTTGIGIDLALPITEYVRIRAGYNFVPRFTIHTDFPIETRGGSVSKLTNNIAGKVESKLAQLGIDINDEGFEEYKHLIDKFSNIEAKDYVTMGLQPNLNHFKFLVDVMPFKHNKHWSFTAGFFIGSSTVGEAWNLDKETLLLEAINTYNSIYVNYVIDEGIKNSVTGGKTSLHEDDKRKDDPFYRYGVAGFPLGKFSDGDLAIMRPNYDATVHAEMEMKSFRPYVGFGYNTHLSRNKRWRLNVDAGVLFLCGKPKVYVDNVFKINAKPLDIEYIYDEDGEFVVNKIDHGGIGFDIDDNYYGDIVRYFYNEETEDEGYMYSGKWRNHVDLMNDLHDIPGKVGDMVDFFSKLKVYPNISVGVSFRLF